MIENQTQPEQKGSKIKWVALTIGGCLVLIACLALASVLIVQFYGPQIGGIFSQVGVGQNGNPEVPQATTTSQQNPESNFNTMGDPNAPVKIVEYADFQCPYCQRYWQETEPQIIKTYVATGKVYYEYRSMGAFIGPESGAAAEAAYCAGDQGKFWEYHDALYSHWTGENAGDFATAKLHQYAVTIGLDTKTFEDCLAQKKYASRIQQDVDNAKTDGVRATPSFLINGKLLEGAEPFEAFQQAIEAALQGK